MSDSSKQVLPNQRISRRKVFQTATAACLAASATATAAADDEKSEGLPSFKFDIEDQKGWVGEAGSAKEATVTEFPV